MPNDFNSQDYGAVTGAGSVLFTDMVVASTSGGDRGYTSSRHNPQLNLPVTTTGGVVGYNHPVPQASASTRKVESPEKPGLNDFNNPPILNTSELIAGMSLTNLDVNTGDLENLSSNLGTNLKLERESPEAQGNRGGSDSRRGSNNRGGGAGTGGQSAQLDTPDVSCNLDESAKKNNLNR